jgi:tRNA U38,U39,U40 pseudouridine synthase TruA
LSSSFLFANNKNDGEIDHIIDINDNALTTKPEKETTTTTTDHFSPPLPRSTKCEYCSTTFDSRNEFFRHIRNDPLCSAKAIEETMGSNKGIGSRNIEMMKEPIAFLFGYDDCDDDDEISLSHGENRQSSSKDETKAEQASKKIQEVLLNTLRANFVENAGIEITSATQTSLAKLRHSALSQEDGCSAVGDVVTVTAKVPSFITLDTWKRIFASVKSHFESTDSTITVFACRLMDRDLKFHSERSCTQRVYHYILPLSWLPDGDKIKEWWYEPENYYLTDNNVDQKGQRRPHISRSTRPDQPPTTSLKLLKKALRSAESAKVPNRKARRKDEHDNDVPMNELKMAKGRYGALGARERRPWHSFASKMLTGGAVSPNHEPVWRVIDKARIIGFVEEEQENDGLNDEHGGRSEPNAIIEIKGDDFLPEQIRRIVGSAVAISHGWLPPDFFSLSTSDKSVVETPLAPAGRLYLAGTRFHFDELLANGLPLFENYMSRRIVEEWNESSSREAQFLLQQRILMKKNQPIAKLRESEWLKNLQLLTCPKICQQLESQKNLSLMPGATASHDDFDDCYLPVLSELRRIVRDGEWPETSMARSSIIRGNDENDAIGKRGSFTIVNPSCFSKNGTVPLGNTLFPKLVEEVFQLESVLSEHTMDRVTLDGLDKSVRTSRATSSHCAVNCNAQFTPHVDSGVGK